MNKDSFPIGTISRIWHGYTTPDNADAFEKLLTEVAIPGIQKNKPDGLLGIQVMKRKTSAEVEFTTIMWFRNLEAVKKFAGDDYQTAHIDPSVKPLLTRYDSVSQHSTVLFASDFFTGK